MGTTSTKTYPADEDFNNYSLICLDSSIHRSQRCSRALQNVIERLRLFDDFSSVEKYFSSLDQNERILFVVNDRLARDILVRIHSHPQLVSIFIFSSDHSSNEHWSQDYEKIRGVSNTMDKLIDQIRLDLRRLFEDSLEMSFFDSTMIHQKFTRDLYGRLIHLPFVINKILQPPTETTRTLDDLIDQCREELHDDIEEMKSIRRFQRNYSAQRAIGLFLKEPFVRTIFNRALQRQDIDLLSRFQFLLIDIQRQIERKQHRTSIRTYRAVFLAKDRWKIFEKSLGDFLSIDSFLICSKDKKSVVQRFDHSPTGLKCVLFKFDADPIAPFANLKHWIQERNNEILFMIGSIFQIIQIAHSEKRISTITLRLCSSHQEQFDNFYHQDEFFAYGHVLMTIGKLDTAKKFYRHLLKRFVDQRSIRTHCLKNLAVIADEQTDHQVSLGYFQRALEICENQSEIASIYNGIGEVYRKIDDFLSAHEYFQDALNIWLADPLNEDHFKIATCYNNMGILYQEENDYDQALEYYGKALQIREEKCSFDQISLGISCNNIGSAYYCLNRLQDAFSYFERALAIYEQILPVQHPKIASIYNNIGGIYEQRGNLDEALSCYNRAATIYRSIYSDKNYNFTKININITRVTEALEKETTRRSIPSRTLVEF